MDTNKHEFAAALGRVAKDARRRGGKRKYAMTVAGLHGQVTRGDMRRSFARFVTRHPSPFTS